MYDFEDRCAFMSVTLNIGQNYFGFFFLSQYFCDEEVQRYFGFQLCYYVILLSRLWEGLLQHCQITVAANSMGTCQKVKLLLHFR